jgi:hydroxyethylthiazole kinase-like sugar kinase family protein
MWTAGAIALGWLVTVASSAVFPGGHPPMWYVVGAGVVLGSFVAAPVGAGAALTALWGARRAGTGRPP